MKLLFASLLTVISFQAFAIVDMKNANYSNTWTDLELNSSGYDLKVVRTYNSRSLFSGMFGFGWCSEFETSLQVMPEGSLKIKECGSGTEILFSPREISQKDVANTIGQIIAKMKEDKKNPRAPEYFKKIEQKLYDEDDARAAYAKQYGISVQIKEGTKFSANGKEVENIVFAKGYYTRNLPDGTSQRYNPEGRITHIYNKNGNFLKFEYDANGTIREVADDNSRKLNFKYYTNKKVKQIVGPNGLNVEYKFVNFDDLGYVKNAWGHVYNFEYNEFHNLTKATWPDKTSIKITYNDEKDWVTSFTDRDNCTEGYTYGEAPKNPKEHYWSIVKKTCGKEVVAENKYEFWHKQKSDGQYYLERVLTNLNGSTTDIIYHEIFGKPLSIRKNNEKVTFDYYPDGQVKLKNSGNVQMSFEYAPENKKVSAVTIKAVDEKGKVVSSKTTQFKYDPKGNLNFASNTDGQTINLAYDNKGRIATITDQAKKIVKIEYEDRFGKPAIVTRPGLGTITVTYKTNGEINKVDSKEGPTVAMQVASTFNNLLDIIAPATAELYL